MINRIAGILSPRLRPGFLVIGAQKAGTSALFGMLAAHQAVLAPAVKEHHFFDDDERYAHGFASYLQGFPKRSEARGRITFEATPNYLFAEQAAARIHHHLPEVKLIAVLRDPVTRAFSAWNMFCDLEGHPIHGHLHEKRSFEQAVDDELSGKPVLRAHRYLARGNYAGQIDRYIKLFGRSQLLLLGHSGLLRRPEEVIERCCTFLELPSFAARIEHLHRRDNVRPYRTGLDPELRRQLKKYFAPDRSRLQQVLGPEEDLTLLID